MSYLAMSLGDRFCVNRKGETGEVVGASEECEQHGCVWACPQKALG